MKIHIVITTWNNISTDGNGKFIIVTQNSSDYVILNITS
jgi:hypothetical protein